MEYNVGDTISDSEWGASHLVSDVLRRRLPKGSVTPDRIVIMTIKSPRGAELIICHVVGLDRTEEKLNKQCAAIKCFMKGEREWDEAHRIS